MKEESLEKIVGKAIPKITVLGIGGAGGNIVTWMKEKGVAGARIIAINSDAQHLNITEADKRILIGYNVTAGLGCGGYPELAVEGMKENLDEVKREIARSGLIFITAGLGGGTGTGGSPVVAKAAKEIGAMVISVVTIPFSVEKARLVKARAGLKRLSEECDAVIVIDNNRLRKVAGALPLREAFAVANELIASFVKSVSETIALPSLVNMDFADLRSIMLGGGVCAIGVGEGLGDTKVEDATELALSTPLLDIGDVSKAQGALIHVEGGGDMTLDDVNRAAEIVIDRISPTAKVSWGSRVNSTMPGGVRTTVVLTGVESPFLVEEVMPVVEAAEIEATPEIEAEKVEVKKKKGWFW